VLTYLRGAACRRALLFFVDARRRRTKRAGARAGAATWTDSHAGVAGGDARYGRETLFYASERLRIFQNSGRDGKDLGRSGFEDMVRVIRTFRPNIVINGWGGVHKGMGIIKRRDC